MKTKIIKLDSLTINKIAAGEVIERPSSVVKELVENSIDADSTEIIINIQEGGKKLIEIIDNGNGMSHDDAGLAIQRYSTSKIRTADDLFSIHSLGFRGEALASVVSVAQVEITTKAKEDELGTLLSVEGGEIKTDKKTTASNGTRIAVRNLFFNVPVRRKFLKSITTEINHITEFTTKLALAYPNISFSLNHNGKSLISAPKGELISQITSIFGNKVAKACISIEKNENNYSITGFITKPEFSRKSKDYMYIFVNKRPISNKLISDAILQGYGTAMPSNRYPIVFLFLDLPTEEVDVNVHPTKKEIRFSKEPFIFSLVESCVQKSLIDSGLKIFERISDTKIQPTLFREMPKEGTVSSKQFPKAIKTEVTVDDKSSIRMIKRRDQTIEYFLPEGERKGKDKEFQIEKKASIRVIGLIKNTYIIAETEEGLFLCDQHAAHEKINYSKYLNQLENKKISIQKLLAPVSVELKPSEFQMIEEMKIQLKSYGFDVEVFGKNEILIRSIPSIMGVTISHEVAKDIIDIIKEHRKEIKENLVLEDLDFIKEIVSLFACRRSIKAGDKISVREAEMLISELLTLKEPFTCPHGRPTIIILNEKYLEEIFQRDYR
ncbi:MAG: DNA mismatch repair endonuclease MutL [Candidatus Heimdallarchaeota archaeon]|nr:DNA mismatch repair endonuclease MutL [Candidatus Heimdallarchaeota archaeon]MCK4878128.1 DNA mismatch repair endonuclease MutL [Candidatus Heimdallarchaeota archaeon]